MLAVIQGGYMLADGIHAFAGGSYMGQSLGPWALLLHSVGLDPLGTPVRVTFVVLGLALLTAAALAFWRQGIARVPLAVAATLTLWYVPIGSILSIAIFVLTIVSRP